ncbi:hypothetical protein CC79DRAFT_1338262 [Sarocladium strictum]
MVRVSNLVAGILSLGLVVPAVGELYSLVGQPSCNETVVGGFTHPGIFHSCEDLTRMQTKVWAGAEPWTTAFGRMFNESLRGVNVGVVNAFNIRGPLPELPYGQDAWSSNFTVDAQYAYLNTIAFFVTGHPFHRERALHTTRRWTTTLSLLEEYIRGGNGLRYLTAAAEILRSTRTSGWTDGDTKLYEDFAARIRRNWDGTNGLARPDLFFNQGAYANGGALAMAVFINDVELYQQMIKQSTEGANPDPTIDYAIRRQISDHSDYYGQFTEMGRDQGHPAGCLNILSSMAYTASIQGDLKGRITYVDLFEYDDHRLLAGLDYYARYNLGHDTPYEKKKIAWDGTEQWTELAPRDRGMMFRNQQHPTDIGALNAPTAAYYRYKELAPEKMKYIKAYVEAQTPGLDTLAYAKDGNCEDLEFSWDNGYGASYMAVIEGSASRRHSETNETVESRSRNSTVPDVAVLAAGANVSYPLFMDMSEKPFIRLEARAAGGADITIQNLTHVISEYHVPASRSFSTVFLNTTLTASPGHQFLYLHTADKVEVARFNLTGADTLEIPFDSH